MPQFLPKWLHQLTFKLHCILNNRWYFVLFNFATFTYINVSYLEHNLYFLRHIFNVLWPFEPSTPFLVLLKSFAQFSLWFPALSILFNNTSLYFQNICYCVHVVCVCVYVGNIFPIYDLYLSLGL